MKIGDKVGPLTLGAPGGGGVTFAYANGTPILVRHGIEGEEVTLKITHVQKRIAFADVLWVHQPAATRVAHVWPDAGPAGVGGGELGHVEFSAQANWKEAVLASTMRRIGKLENWPDVRLTQFGQTGLGERLRVEVIATDAGRLAMHRYRSDELLEISELPLAHQSLYPLLEQAPKTMAQLAGMRLRAIHTARGARVVGEDGKAYTKAGREAGAVAHYRVQDDEYLASVAGFWQPHREAASQLRQTVSEFASEVAAGERIVDFYCGAGLFTVALARLGAQVQGWEADPDAVEYGQENLTRLAGGSDANIGVRNLGPRQIAELSKGAHIIVADPPRSGLGIEGINAISGTSVRQLIYVSCDYAALARDVGAATKLGWHIDQVRAFDLFPHTHHLETVVSLKR